MSAKQRATTFHPLEAYSFANYLAYALYAPLYIAGPIMTFNDFMWQVRPQTPLLHGPGYLTVETDTHSWPARPRSRRARARTTPRALWGRCSRWS